METGEDGDNGLTLRPIETEKRLAWRISDAPFLCVMTVSSVSSVIK
jgi:hypothetical protein